MGLVSAALDRLSSEPNGGDAAHGERTNGNGPVPGYVRLKERDVVRELSQHSQTELQAIEEYERAHKNRGPVLAKLRYLRGNEPLRDYDAISVEEILDALETADVETVKKVRGYERKFANRRDVLEAVDRVHRTRRDAQPEAPSQRYQAAGAGGSR
jgi:hypothetical protein